MSIYESILITGGGGMLGSALNELLVARGHRPICLTRAHLDIADDAALRRIFAEHRPTLVFNCAAHTKVDLCEQESAKADAINGRAVGVIASLCREQGAALIHVSTDFVFDGTQRRPYRTDDPVHPLSVYGRSKLLGETELQRNAPDRWLIVRTAWVYGRGSPNFPRTMVLAAQSGKPLSVVNDQTGAPTYAPDLALAILTLLDRNQSGLWHVTNSGQTTWFDFARATLEEFEIDAEVAPLTSADWTKLRPQSAPRPAYSVLDIEPYAKATGQPMRPWDAALADFRRTVQERGFEATDAA